MRARYDGEAVPGPRQRQDARGGAHESHAGWRPVAPLRRHRGGPAGAGRRGQSGAARPLRADPRRHAARRARPAGPAADDRHREERPRRGRRAGLYRHATRGGTRLDRRSHRPVGPFRDARAHGRPRPPPERAQFLASAYGAGRPQSPDTCRRRGQRGGLRPAQPGRRIHDGPGPGLQRPVRLRRAQRHQRGTDDRPANPGRPAPPSP